MALKISRSRVFVVLGLLTLAVSIAATMRGPVIRMGRQPDGSFLVSSGQRIEGGSIAFNGRPIDLAVHPRDEVFAVLNKSEVFLATAKGDSAGNERLAWAETLGRVPRARLVARRHAALRQHRPRLRPVFAYKGGKLKDLGEDPRSARGGQG